MRAILATTLCVALLAACGGGGAEGDDGPTTIPTTSTVVAATGVASLECPQGTTAIQVAVDYFADAAEPTPQEALDVFAAGGGIPDGFSVHPDDEAVGPGATRVVDGRGRVVLVVHITGDPGGWVVSGYDACE